MSSKRIHKLTLAWGVMGTLAMLAASAVLASPATRAGAAPRVERASRPASVPATLPASVSAPVADARLDQFVADARALWPDLSPDVREMVLELVRSRGRQADLAALTALEPASSQLADARKLQATQAFVTE
ncbi:MAG: hypothetical protein RLZZ524_243 [Pseudomonadota bacterium]